MWRDSSTLTNSSALAGKCGKHNRAAGWIRGGSRRPAASFLSILRRRLLEASSCLAILTLSSGWWSDDSNNRLAALAWQRLKTSLVAGKIDKGVQLLDTSCFFFCFLPFREISQTTPPCTCSQTLTKECSQMAQRLRQHMKSTVNLPVAPTSITAKSATPAGPLGRQALKTGASNSNGPTS